MASLPTLPLEIQNKIMIEHKGFNPYPFNEEFKFYVNCCLDFDYIILPLPEGVKKSREWRYSQFEDEDSDYYEEWGNMSYNILSYIEDRFFEDRKQ